MSNFEYQAQYFKHRTKINHILLLSYFLALIIFVCLLGHSRIVSYICIWCVMGTMGEFFLAGAYPYGFSRIFSNLTHWIYILIIPIFLIGADIVNHVMSNHANPKLQEERLIGNFKVGNWSKNAFEEMNEPDKVTITKHYIYAYQSQAYREYSKYDVDEENHRAYLAHNDNNPADANQPQRPVFTSQNLQNKLVFKQKISSEKYDAFRDGVIITGRILIGKSSPWIKNTLKENHVKETKDNTTLAKVSNHNKILTINPQGIQDGTNNKNQTDGEYFAKATDGDSLTRVN